MEEPAGRLGTAIGKLATAVGEKLTPAIDDALEFGGSLLSLLGSGLRVALEWLIENAIPFFEGLAGYISTHSIGEMAYDAFVKPFDDMREKIGLTDEKIAGWKERIDAIPEALGAVRTAFEAIGDRANAIVSDITALFDALGIDLKNFLKGDFDFSESKQALEELMDDLVNGAGSDRLDTMLEQTYGGMGGKIVDFVSVGVGAAKDKLSAKIGETVVGAEADAEPAIEGASRANGVAAVTSYGDGAYGRRTYASGKFVSVATEAVGKLDTSSTAKKHGTGIVTNFGNGGYARRSYSNSKFLAVGKGAMTQLNWVDTPKKYGTNIGTYFGNSVYARRSYVGSKAYAVGESAVYNLYWPETSKKYGRWTTEGFAIGMEAYSAVKKVVDSAAYIAGKALQTLKDTINAGSPSKETALYGNWFDEGFAIGMDEEASLVERSSRGLAETALDALSVVGDAGSLDVGGTIGSTMSVDQLATGQFELDWARMEQAVAQGTLEGFVAGGMSGGSGGGRAELVLQVNGQTLGRVALDAIDRMAANGMVDLDLVGV